MSTYAEGVEGNISQMSGSAKSAHERGIEDQITRADLVEIDEILDHIARVYIENPELIKRDPNAKHKIDLASSRFKKLLGISLDNQVVH